MACNGCDKPMHEQFKNYPGHWYCFHPKACGRTICHTPPEAFGDRQAHGRILEESKHPKWCPLQNNTDLKT